MKEGEEGYENKPEHAPPELFKKNRSFYYILVLRLQKPKVSDHGLILLELSLEESTW